MAAVPAHAQAWPQRTVRFIVPLPPGSGMDLSARVVAEQLAQEMGPGRRGREPPGRRRHSGRHGISSRRATTTPSCSRSASTSRSITCCMRSCRTTSRTLVPIVPVIENFMGMSVTAKLNVDTLADFIKLAKSQPGKLNYAVTAGLAGLCHAGAAAEHRHRPDPYSLPRLRRPPIPTSTPAGCTRSATGIPTQVAHHRAGTAKLLFVTNSSRSPQVPGRADRQGSGVSGSHLRRPLRHLRLARHAGRDRQRMAADVGAIVADPGIPRTRAQGRYGSDPGTQAQFAASIDNQRGKSRQSTPRRRSRSAEALSFGGRLPSLGAIAAGGNAMRLISSGLAAVAAGVLASFVLLAARRRRCRRRAGRRGRCASSSRSGRAPAPTSARG